MPDDTDNPKEEVPPEPLSDPLPPATDAEPGELDKGAEGMAAFARKRAEYWASRNAGVSVPSAVVKGDGGEESEVVPVRRAGRFSTPAPRVSWTRRLVPLAGLALLLSCLWALIGTGQFPSWQPWWTGAGLPGNAAVIIDPGHGGGDSGAVALGVVEKDLNLDVGLRVGRALRARGVAVKLTREDDHFVPLEGRVRLANALPGAVFVSIHFNDASGNGQATGRASGIETYYCEHKLPPASDWTLASLLGSAKVRAPDERWAVREGQTLADCIQGSLIAGTGAENRGIKERSLYVTHRVMGPAVLVEGGFVSHPGEARRLGDVAYRQTLAECIAEGIVKYLRGTRPAPTPGLTAAAGAGA